MYAYILQWYCDYISIYSIVFSVDNDLQYMFILEYYIAG